jgi:hypothetical protein
MPPVGVIFSILQGYQASQDFRDLAVRTRKDYIAKIKLIEKAFGDFPLTALSDRRTRGVFLAWRDRLALSSRRQADYSWVVLARVLSWGLNRGLIPANPCEKGGRLYGGSRADKVWSPADEANFLQKGPVHLHLPLLLALWTGLSAKGICFAFLGRAMMATAFGCASRRLVSASQFRSGRHSRQHSMRRRGRRRAHSSSSTRRANRGPPTGFDHHGGRHASQPVSWA